MFYIFKEKMFQRCCSAFSQAILKHWLECKYILNHEVSDDLLDFRMARTALEKTLNCVNTVQENLELSFNISV